MVEITGRFRAGRPCSSHGTVLQTLGGNFGGSRKPCSAQSVQGRNFWPTFHPLEDVAKWHGQS